MPLGGRESDFAVCMTIVGKVLEVQGKKGVVEVEGKKREIDLKLVDAKAGDFVSCALGLAVEKLDPKEARAILDSRDGIIEGK